MAFFVLDREREGVSTDEREIIIILCDFSFTYIIGGRRRRRSSLYTGARVSVCVCGSGSATTMTVK